MNRSSFTASSPTFPRGSRFPRVSRASSARLVGLALALVAAATTGLAHAKFAKSGTSSLAHFHAAGPAGMSIDGTTPEVAVADDGTNLTIRVTLTALDTGIRLRNDHMRNKYLEVAKYPDATVTVARASLSLPPEGQSRSGNVPATLTLHGVSHPVTLHYDANASHGVYGVKGTTSLNMNDYGIVVPVYLGVTVSPKVDIDVAFSAVDA